MTKRFESYLTTIISSLVTVALTLISDFLLKLPNEITWLTFFIGAIVTIAATLVEQRLLSTTQDEIEKKLEIYKLLSQISDPEFLQYGQTAIKQCEEKLRDLAKGIFEDTAHVYMTGRIEKAQTRLQATFWVQNKFSIYNLEDTPAGQSYQSSNRALLKRGVKIERIFILNKADVLDSNGRFTDSKSLKIIQTQLNDGIDVRVSWLDDWQAFDSTGDLNRDFGILDEKEVAVHIYGARNIPTKVLVIKNAPQVDEYKEVFSKIRKLSHPLTDVLNQHPMPES